MKTIYKILLVGFGLSLSINTNAQNQSTLSQYMLYQPFLNPAALSTYNDLSFGLVHRSQWTGFNDAPRTSMVSLNTPLRKTNFSIGLGYQGEEIGVLNSDALFSNLNYRFQVNQTSFISAGLSLGIDMFQLRYSKLINSEEDPEFGYGSSTKNLINPLARFGLNYFTNDFYVTAFIPNLLKPEVSGRGDDFEVLSAFDVNNLHYYVQSGYKMEVSSSIDANFSALIKVSSTTQYDINAQLVFNKFLGVGVSYRVNSAIVGLANVTINKKVKIGYSYDYAINGLSNVQNGTHEIIAIFDLNRESLNAKIQVPRF
jgi:type IX secretion system PorP/SprF family membrane protein